MLKIYNSLSKKKEDFVPNDPDHIKFYACGPTVYNKIHIGNARAFISADLLAKVLKGMYSKVTYVCNITDIDDKIIDAAKEENLSIKDISTKYFNQYQEDTALLGISKPDIQPFATDYIDDMIAYIEKLIASDNAYEKDGAIWLNTDISGDDKHRVLIREDGRATYFASDVAYHKNKIDRGFDKLINIWGADHHGYIKRIEASIETLGSSKEKLIVKLVQFANLFKEGKKIKMSTRSGEFFTLKDLIDDIGTDAARFYYLSKQADQHLDFDIDLAKSDSKENIFYYIQYAHARIVSLEEKALKKNSKIKTNINNIENNSYKECDKLIHEISKYPYVVNKAANALQPHLVIYYLRDLAQLFHSYYNDNHVLSETDQNIESILACLLSVKQVISNGLELLGISPIEKM